MFSIYFRLTDFERALQHCMGIDDFKVELHLAAIDAGQVQ